jgi:hypothetical protein
MVSPIRRGSRIWACSLLLLFGCSGLTIGPVVEKKAIIVHAGTAIEILEDIEVDAHLLQDVGTTNTFRVNVGGWIAMHPDHWDSLKKDYQRLKVKAGEAK